jgi:hypothetical protein
MFVIMRSERNRPGHQGSLVLVVRLRRPTELARGVARREPESIEGRFEARHSLPDRV